MGDDTAHGKDVALVSIEVTVRDTETGESETGVIDNDYILVTAGTCYQAHVNAHANGTHVITIKGRATS